MKHFKYFENETVYNSERNNNYIEPWVSWTVGKGVDYNKIPPIPLTFEIESDGILKWLAGGNSPQGRTIEYNKNGGEWTSITSAAGDSAPSIDVLSGDIIQFRGNNDTYTPSTSGNYTSFSGSTCSFKVRGNILSLIKSTEFDTLSKYSGTFTFQKLFLNCGVTDASGLLFPTFLNYGCYEYMFQNCTSLVNPPVLPAVSLSDECYYHMFDGCTSLTFAPLLPATKLKTHCYGRMFIGCSSLNYVECLATDISANYCVLNWLSGVSTTGTFVKASGVESWTTGVSGIPEGWTVQTATE